MPETRIALVGDYSVSVLAHKAIPLAIDLIAQRHNWLVSCDWLSTRSLETDGTTSLSQYRAVWCVPGSPYESETGAIAAIRYARENYLPFLGTCGGCQHAILEFARNVLGIKNAEHAELNPSTSLPLIAPLSCGLVKEKGTIHLETNSMLYKIYGMNTVEEGYNCRYGLNPKLEYLLNSSDLKVSGRDNNGEVRAMELTGRKFYVLAQFQPERAALEGKIPAVVEAFVAEAVV